MITQDIPKLYTALAEWMGCMSVLWLCRSFLRGRWRLWSVFSLPVLMGIQWICGKLTGPAWLAGMCAATLVMFLTIRFSASIEESSAAYMTCHAFMAAETFAALSWQLDFFLGLWETQAFPHPLSGLFCLGTYVLLFAGYTILEDRSVPEFARGSFQTVTRTQLVSAIATTLAFFAMSNLSYVTVRLPFTGSSAHEIFNIRSLMDMIGLGVIYSMNAQRMEQLAVLEHQSIGERMRSQYQLYLQAEENHALINRKYHDLKHQLSVLRAASPEERIAQLDDFAAGLNAFEDEFDTGNRILDTILAEKNGACRSHQIDLAVMADGRLVSRLLTMDLCALFGNALDNAIETESRQDGYRRIRVEVSLRQGAVCICFENHCSSAVDLQNGLPATTKQDKAMHGFGLKSIRSIAEKYGGIMTIDAKDGIFTLRILLPQEDAKQEMRGAI